MAKKTKAYVDTSAFIALLDKSDSHNPLFKELFLEPPRLLTSSLVISEGQAWFLRRYDSRRALGFLDFINLLDNLEINPVDTSLIQEASKLLKHFSDQELTLTDAIGLVLMSKNKIQTCWSTDRHLGLTGVSLATHPD
ncbi:MAG: PIN domain-containing protein [Myxococcaceae bacterium]